MNHRKIIRIILQENFPDLLFKKIRNDFIQVFPAKLRRFFMSRISSNVERIKKIFFRIAWFEFVARNSFLRIISDGTSGRIPDGIFGRIPRIT